MLSHRKLVPILAFGVVLLCVMNVSVPAAADARTESPMRPICGMWEMQR